jgi:hypothetical protein
MDLQFNFITDLFFSLPTLEKRKGNYKKESYQYPVPETKHNLIHDRKLGIREHLSYYERQHINVFPLFRFRRLYCFLLAVQF